MLQPNLRGLLTTAVLLAAGAAAAQDPDPPVPVAAKIEDRHGLRPPHSTAKLIELAELARDRGLQFLVDSQNGDGSWGSHDPKIANLKNFGFPLLDRGAQDGLRTACTAICAQALTETPNRTPEQDDALQRAVDELLIAKRISFQPGGTFNTWGYGYKLDFLARWVMSPLGQADRARVEASAKICVDGLRRFQQADGGWNYYATAVMGGTSMSFNTANFVIALQRARAAGIQIVPEMLNDAVKLLKRMRTARGGFVYDARSLHSPRAVNELSAGSRTAVCALALLDAGEFKEADLIKSMAIFEEGANYLEDGRKLIQPHTAVHQISGYFFFYGYYYATIMAERMGERFDRERWDRLVWTFVRTQERNGRWWDTPAADYGDKWATGFVLESIQRYLDYDKLTMPGGE